MVASRSLYACVILPLSGSLARAVRDARSASLPPGIEVPTHITVLPPWRATAGEINALLAHTATVGETCSPFEVSSGEIGTFEPISPVVYLNIARGRESIFRLHRQLKAGVPGADSSRTSPSPKSMMMLSSTRFASAWRTFLAAVSSPICVSSPAPLSNAGPSKTA